MSSWEPFAFAMFRGVVAATPLDDDRRAQVLGLIDDHRVKVIAKAEATLRAGGLDAPSSTPDEGALTDVERLAKGAWTNLSQDDQKRLRNLAKLVALEEDPFELTSLLEDWCARVCNALLGQPLVRGALLGALQGEAPPLGPGQVLAGKFRLERLLGEGGFGQVYAATHLDLGREVAVKVMRAEVAHNEDAKQRFLREVAIATSFVHKYAAQVREFGRDRIRGSLYCTMDLVEGETLRQLLKREKTLGVQRTLALAVQVLEALEEAHAAGLVHRDIKPSNLMVVEGRDGPEVRILDFGIAKAIVAGTTAPEAMNLTLEGQTVGTLSYMSPEQAEGVAVDGRSDLYSLGVVIYECLSGELPISARRDAIDSRRAFLTHLLTKPPRDLGEVAPSLSKPLRDAVMKCLAKERDERYPDAGAFRSELLRLMGQDDGTVDRGATTQVDYQATMVEMPAAKTDDGYQATLPDLSAKDHAELAALRAENKPPAEAPPAGGKLLRLVAVGALGCFLVALVGGVSAIWWGPKVYDLARKRFRSPEVAAAAEEARDEVEKLEAATRRLAKLEAVTPPSSAIAEARELKTQAEEAWGQDELEQATKVYQESRSAYRRALSAIAGQLRERADASLAGWAPLARAFQLEAPGELSEARELVSKGARAAADGEHQQAAEHFINARTRYLEALAAADKSPPQVRLAAPLDGHATTQGAVRLEGRVEDATLRSIELDGSPLDARPDGIGAHAFSLEVPLEALGKKTLTITARDASGLETVVTRSVERKAVPLQVTIETPKAGAGLKQREVQVAGKVVGPVPVEGVTVNGEAATVSDGGFTHTLEATREGRLELTVIARGAFAEGRAKRAVLVDWTAPALELTKPPAQADSVYLTLQGTVSDATACSVRVERQGKVVAQVDTKPGRDQAVKLGVRLSDGENALRVVAVDAVGNASPAVEQKVSLSASARLLGPFKVGDGRYVLNKTLTIPSGERLVVPAGTLMTFGRGAGIEVRGALVLAGKPTQRVLLTGTGWSGLSVFGSRSRIELHYATIRDARKEKGGGVVVGAGGTLRASQTIFSKCSASRFGGAIYLNGNQREQATARLERVTFLSCRADQEGGAVNANFFSLASFDGCKFTNNRATGYGGGLLAIGDANRRTLISVRNSRFEGNEAKYGGALMVARGGKLTLERVVAARNSATHGAGMFLIGVEGADAWSRLVGCSFVNNTAKDSGGGVRIRGFSTLEVRGGNLTDNKAVYGGGIDMLGHAKSPAKLIARDAQLERNVAKEGGGANVNTFASATFERCTFRRNSARVTGGGLIAFGKKPTAAGPLTDLILVGNTFDKNVAPARRGPDLRVARSVRFDTKSLASNGLVTGRYQLDKSRQPAPAPKPTQPTPTSGGGAYAAALQRLISMGRRNDFSPIRGAFKFTSSTGSRCYESTLYVPGAYQSRVWIRKDMTHYVFVGLARMTYLARAQSAYRKELERLKRALPGWSFQEKRIGTRGSVSCYVTPTSGKRIKLRLDLMVLGNPPKLQASVSLFVN